MERKLGEGRWGVEAGREIWGGCLEKIAEARQTLKKEVFSPWGKKSLEYLFSPWLKFPEVQMDFRRAADLCISIGLCCLPLSLGGLLELNYQDLPHADVMHWLSKGLAHKRECSVWLCHCYKLVSAELEKEEKLTHSFLVWLTSVLPVFPPARNVVRLSGPWVHWQALDRHMSVFLPPWKERGVFTFL